MNLTKKDAEKLINDSQFMFDLGKCLTNKQLSMDLLKEKGFEISEQEYEELLHSANKFSECSDEELKKISGGGRGYVTKVKTKTYYHEPDSTPMPAIGAVLVGSAMSLIGLGVAIAGTYKCCKDGPLAPM